MTITTFFWAIAGVLVGGMHSLALKHSSSNANEWAALIGLTRIVLIGGLLTAAAILGYLFSALVGWVIGFVVTLAIVLMQMK